jgi:GTP cyclohydrolase II
MATLVFLKDTQCLLKLPHRLPVPRVPRPPPCLPVRPHIRLTSHAGGIGALPIHWGAATPAERGPVVGTTTKRSHRNVIGTHSGSYSVYRALAVAAGRAQARTQGRPHQHLAHRHHRPLPAVERPRQDRQPRPLGRPWPTSSPRRTGRRLRHPPDHRRHQGPRHPAGGDRGAAKGRLKPDGKFLTAWRRRHGHQGRHRARLVPARRGQALRLQRDRPAPRAVRGNRRHVPRTRHAQRPRGVPAPDRRPDHLHLRRPARPGQPRVELTARVHDECNGSDVFGSDICTCRPYLTHAIEECIQGAQRGGVGLVSYSRKEGRALGEVTKFLVYNARKRQVGGDTADQYFARTECVAGVQDMRFQELMPDVLHWLGVRKIHRLVSMSNMKYDAITKSGIEVGVRVNIPDELIPPTPRSRWTPRWRPAISRPAPCRTPRNSKNQGPGAGPVRQRPVPGPPQGDLLAAAALRTTVTVRERCGQLLRRARIGESAWFTVDEALRERRRRSGRRHHARRYPKLHIPYHSRWRHFEAGGVDRKAELETLLGDVPAPVRGAPWSTSPSSACCSMPAPAPTGATSSPRTGKTFTRSEGLGVASFHAFTSGMFSSDKDRPLQVDAARPARLVTELAGRRLPGHREQPAGRPRRPRGAAAPAGRGDAGAARGVRPTGGRPASSTRCLADGRHRRTPPTSPRTTSCRRSCSQPVRHLARATASAACRWATAGATAPCAAKA